MKTSQLRMSLRLRSHEIVVGAGALSLLPKLLKSASSQKAFLISDESLLEARLSTVASLKKGGWIVHEIPVKAGESLKDIGSVYALYGKLLEGKADRDSVLFALGGGSVGDTVGFVAATFLRGLAWVGLPTTVLAQVDSAVGGKTGINHEFGKNLIGAFYQPSLVVCDTDLLKTLTRRELISGLAEIVKYALVFDPLFFSFLKKNTEAFLDLDPKVMQHATVKSLRWKCKMVSQDEFERKGKRALLNFGHTFAHAIEVGSDYQHFQHGEAVLWGMRFALALSEIRGKLSRKNRLPMEEYLSSLSVPEIPKTLSLEKILESMKYDKKAKNGKIRFILLKKIGKPYFDSEVLPSDLIKAFDLLNHTGIAR